MAVELSDIQASILSGYIRKHGIEGNTKVAMERILALCEGREPTL